MPKFKFPASGIVAGFEVFITKIGFLRFQVSTHRQTDTSTKTNMKTHTDFVKLIYQYETWKYGMVFTGKWQNEVRSP